MFQNYLIVALRNVMRHKSYSLINVLGLATGMACVVLIMLFIQYELRYDQNHAKADQIYRVLRETRSDTKRLTNERTSGALAHVLQNDYPEVHQVVRTARNWAWINHGKKGFFQSFCLADENILDVFTFPLVKGNRQTALREPSTILITQEIAQKYFGQEDPIGKTVTVDYRNFGGEYRIVGVLKDIPPNSFVRFDFLISPLTASNRFFRLDTWEPSGHRYFETFIYLPQANHVQALEQKIQDIFGRYMGDEVAKTNTYHLHPLNRAYLHSTPDFNMRWSRESGNYGDINTIYAFSLIAFFILLIACINFMNLSTARATARAEEVGLRKVVGAHRVQLITQFLGESTLLSILALIVALFLTYLFLPTFNMFVDKQLSLNIANNTSILLTLPIIALCVGMLSGSYPAFFLSAFQPVHVLKGAAQISSKSAWFRKGLVVFQFAISVTLIIGTTVVYTQLNHIRTKDLGFDKTQTLVLPIFIRARETKTWGGYGMGLKTKYNMVKHEFSQHPNVLQATTSQYLPGIYAGTQQFGAEGQIREMAPFCIDENFLAFYDIELITGRNFTKTYIERIAQEGSHDNYEFILNEAAVKEFGWTDPVGKPFVWKHMRGGTEINSHGTIIGVVKDFHTGSLRNPIAPIVFFPWISQLRALQLKVTPTNLPETLQFLEAKWDALMPDRPFEYYFLDEGIDEHYQVDIQLSQVFSSFSLLAIFIACLGLFGLTAFTTQQRTKEIGVRKILGASVSHIIYLLSRDIIKLVLIAVLIACPMGYYAMNEWLQDFTYRISLSSWMFIISGLLALLIALATVSYQAFKSATSNPVDALRNE